MFKKIAEFPKRHPAAAIFLFAFFLRAWNIGADLPHLYIADEPHHLNMAARIGSGDLNPHDFKYPSLWKYTLASTLGGLYAGGRLLGLTTSPMDFASSFFLKPTIFYLSARLLAAALFALASFFFFKIGDRFYDRRFGILAGLFLALSPAMAPFGRDATLNALMVALIAAALYALHFLRERAQTSDYILSGALIGLSVSTHYIAAPLAVLIPAIHFSVDPNKRNWKNLFIGLLSIGGGFVAGSPFFLLDFHHSIGDILNMAQLHVEAVGRSGPADLASRAPEAQKQWKYLVQNTVGFLDPWGIGTVLLLTGVAFRRTWHERWSQLVWTLPMVATWPLLLSTYHGGFYRYSLGIFIPLLIPAAAGFMAIVKFLETKAPRVAVIAIIAVFLPFSLSTIHYVEAQALPDTRTQAQEWIESHVAAGEKVLLADPYNCPQLLFSRNQVADLLKRTAELKHPRERYYAAILNKHPGGGYHVFYLRRSLSEVEDTPKRTEAAYQALDTIDPAEVGLAGLKKEGIKLVVLYADVETKGRHQEWLADLKSHAVLGVSFSPSAHLVKGPPLEVYLLP